jgi:hypothetical protein
VGSHIDIARYVRVRRTYTARTPRTCISRRGQCQWPAIAVVQQQELLEGLVGTIWPLGFDDGALLAGVSSSSA